MNKKRYLTKYITDDLSDKMVFLGGARQVGKTTLARELIGNQFAKTSYYNWDNRVDRRSIMQSDWAGDAELLIFDEIHKYKKWKTLIKGEYDKYHDRYKFIVTGSARLDVYRKGGDSLQGRYHYYRLHPFSLSEILELKNNPSPFEELRFNSKTRKNEFESIDRFGGFPEPLIKQNTRVLRRWHNEKLERLFREDVRDLAQVRDLASMQLLSDILPQRIGSLLSRNSLREDLEVSHRAVSSWLDILESLYYCFRIYPFTSKNYRSLKKEPKLYLYDWSEIDDDSSRFENCIASHLLKLVHFLIDYEGYRAGLFFLRNSEKKEVDFLVTVDSKPWFAVEVKLGGEKVSPNLFYFKEKLAIPYVYQVVKKTNIDRLTRGVRMISADKFLSGLI